ncbi:MAG: hypothetical protein M3Q52_01915 [Pseudomonadota bacterium]|nr:hypothetical protein [Pseudomonadota bacterium]
MNATGFGKIFEVNAAPTIQEWRTLPQAEYFGAPAHLRQARCDLIQAQFRKEQAVERPRVSIRREPPPLDPALVPTDDALKLRVAEELEYARRLIEVMGDALCNDPQLVMRHSVSLQSVDVVGQMLGHLAAVVRSSQPERAVDRIGMTELKLRLARSSVG